MGRSNPEKVSLSEVKRWIVTQLPGLMRRDPEIKSFVISVVEKEFAKKKETDDRFEKILNEIKQLRGEGNAKWEEWEKRWEEERQVSEKRWEEWEKRWEEERRASEKRWEEWEKRWEEERRANEKRWEEWEKRWEEERRVNEKRWEEWEKRWEENQKVIQTILNEIKRLDRRIDQTLGAIGARWGVQSETAFREAMKAILEESFAIKVERYHTFDEKGEVFGEPEQIELDIVIFNGQNIAVEIKSSVSRSDLAIFLKKIRFYEKKKRKKVTRKIIISPMFDPRAAKAAKRNKVEVYSFPEETKF